MYVYPALEFEVVTNIVEGIICKNCSSNHIVKHGYNYTVRGKIQRYFCKSCNHNFN